VAEVIETMQAPGSVVWREAGGFRAVGVWHPMLDRVEIDGESVGAARTLHGKDGSVQVERPLAVDRTRRAHGYITEKAAMPVLNYTAEFRVNDAGEDTSHVTWSAKFDLAEGGSDKTAMAVRQFLRAGHESPRARYEARSI
jgi:hypothetical protein